jgi:protein-L-isoaspartate O-methyltransferase
MSEQPPEVLRSTFDKVPEQYDRARPSYPPAVFSDLVELAQLPVGARLVEIGCGTGQATIVLAQMGYDVTCVELGEQLAAYARSKLTPYPSVEVVNAEFESWRPERKDFDAVVAFSSFHWIPPAVRYTKSAALLNDHGKLAFVSVAHVLPEGGDQFFVDVQRDYEAVVPEDPQTKADAAGPPRPDVVRELSDRVVTAEIAASGCLQMVGIRHHLWDVTYDAEGYIAVLGTYSGHLALDPGARLRLMDRIRERIEARPDGKVRKSYMALLYVAERL